MDLKEIQSLIKFVSKSGVNEVKLEVEDFKITIKTGKGIPETTIVHQAPIVGAPMPVATAPVAQALPTPAESTTTNDDDSKYITITYHYTRLSKNPHECR